MRLCLTKVRRTLAIKLILIKSIRAQEVKRERIITNKRSLLRIQNLLVRYEKYIVSTKISVRMVD